MNPIRVSTVASAGFLLMVPACSVLPPPVTQAPATPATQPGASSPGERDATPVHDGVSATLLPGQPPALSNTAVRRPLRAGDVSLDYPGVDVQVVARVVLGDILHVPYTIAPDIHTPISLVPGRGIARADVSRALEEALQPAGLALTRQGGEYAILPVAQARTVAPVGADAGPGYATEVAPLRFVNAEEMRKLIEPVLPGVATSTDAATNSITLSGASGQRASAKDLIRQFDVDWLRGTSFGLFVPRRTDARLIVPELDKVLNADGAPTRNLVRLIAMDRLNGILAVSTQPQYLDDVRRWIEILDREGESTRRRLFVYHVQNGRAADLSRTLVNAFSDTRAGVSAPSGHVGVATDGLRSDQGIAGGSGTLGVASFQPQGAGSAAGQASPDREGPAGSSGEQGASRGLMDGELTSSGGGTSAQIQTADFQAKITSDEVNNAVVVYATPLDYAVVEDALRKLDISPTQVLIEAAIVEVTLTNNLRFGVQGLYNNAGLSVGITQSATSAAPIQAFPGFAALYAARTVTAALNALEGLTTVKVVSAPKVMVLNNQTASIQVGSQVPILTGSATNVVTSNAAIVNSVDYRETGIILKITPRVNSSGGVLLDLAQEVSDVVPAPTTASIQSPTFSDRKIATSVSVRDGEVIALGGLIRDNRTSTRTGLPVLSRIPLLGALLFGSVVNDDERTELIVLMQPKVVRSVDDGRAVTDELLDKLRLLHTLLPTTSMP